MSCAVLPWALTLLSFYGQQLVQTCLRVLVQMLWEEVDLVIW